MRTILQLVILNHLDDIEWRPISDFSRYFASSPNLYQYMEKMVAIGLIDCQKRIGTRSNGRPTMFNMYRLSDRGLKVLKESKTYLLREVISDESVGHGACMGT